MVTGRYWHHLKPELPAAEAMDVSFDAAVGPKERSRTRT